ncbi:MAG: PAS domain S-box protein [Anaerolineae bacterium]|nr:PAS domain S-box protein [Anaerolineae bacterium]
MQDGLTIIEGREVVHINDRLEEILGYPKEQIARMSSLDYAAPEEIERIKTVMQEARSGKRDLTDLAFWIVRPDGQRRFIHNRYSMITDESGQITGRFVFTTDETDREVAEAERQRFTLRLNTASEIVSQVNAILDPEKVLQAVIPLLKERFGLYYVHVYTLDEELQELQLQAGYGEPGRIMLERGHTIPLDRKQSLVASAARAGELVLVDDVTEDPNFLPNPLLPDTKTEVAVPMIVGEQVLGVFDIQHDQAHFFTDADLDIFRTLAGQLATTLYNAGLFTQTQMRLRVGRALAATQTEDEVWDALIGVADFYPEAQVSLFTFDPNAAERTLVLRRIDSFASGLVEAVSPGMPFPEKAFPVISQITADEPFVSANVFADDRVDAGTQGLSQQTGGVSMALLPILAGDEWLGLIAVLSSQKGYFDTRKLHLYKALAEQGGVALQAARLNEAIDASARRFRGLYEASPLGIILNDFETGEYLEANEAFVGMVGHSLDELNQLTYWDLTPRKYAGDEQKQIHAMETTGRYGPYEKEYIRKDGTVLPVILNGVVVTDPNGRRVIWSTVEDITARKEAEAALQLTRASIEQSQDAYFWFDAEAIFTDVSDATCAILGYSREELLALRVFDIDPVFPEEAWPGLKEQVKAAGTVTLESQHRTKEGKTFPVEVSVSHLQFGGEEIYFSVAKDITDRKEAESRVRIFQALAENAADAITMGDVGGRVTYANRAAHEMLGYDYEQREMHGMSMSQLAAEEEIARQNGAVQQIMANGGGWTGDANSKRKDGTFVDVSITMFPVLDENAQPVSIAAILRDITDRKAAEQERERFTNQLATAADISTRASTILDPQRLLQAAVELIKTRFDLYHVHVYTLNQETWTLDIQAGSGEAGKIMREQGHSIPLVQERSLVARAARDGEIIVVTDVTEGADFMPNPLLPETRTEVTIPLMVGDDILGVFDVQDDEAGRFTAADLDVFRTLAGQLATALRNAQLFATQQQVETQLRRERQLFVGGPVVVFRWVNTEGWPVEYVSPNVETFIGHPAKALMSSEVPYATLVHPDDLARVGSEVQQFSEEGHSYFEQEYRMVRADGEVIWIYDFTIVIRNERGEITHYDGYIMDITARKEAEATAIAQAERSRALLETIPDMMFLFNQDGTFLDFKAEAGQELLVPPELFLGRKVHQVLPPHIADLTMENLHKALATRKLHTFVYQSPIGEEVHTYEARIGRVSPTTGLGLVRDITERQRAQAERERFAAQLSTAAEIARQVGTILDTDELLNTVIPLLKERFGLYHAQVYVLEEATGDLVLRAGYGPIGQIMLEQGHRIGAEQEQSLVQRAATIRDVVVANDVLQEADFMPNLLLPETRAEVAVPAMIGEQVIGVFDVQSDQVDFFTEADLNVYRTLAGQIASAFQTARLFEQQKETQQALRAAVEKTRAIFEAMTEGLVVTGMMGKIEDLNDATLRLHGFKNREEVVGRSAMQLFDRAYWSRAAETMRRAMEMGRSELSAYRMIRSDRSTFEAEMNAALLRDADGKPAGFVNIIRDITERTRAEAERARFAAELRTAADISSQVTSILDPQELLDRVVALMKEQFNLYHVNIYTLDAEARRLTLTASYGETGRILVTQSQPISLEAEGSLVARAARDKEIILIEDVAEAPDLQPHPLLPQVRSQVAVPALFGHQVLGVFEVLHNEAHYFTQADLDVFRTLAGQTAASFQNARYFEEIQQAAERLREMDQLKSEFLANMSHELRTPLNSIIGYAEVMLMGIDGELDTETLEDVRAIYENGQHLLAMINDVLDLAKIEAGRLNLKLEDLDLGVLLEDVKTSSVGLLNKYKKQEHVEVQVTVEDDLPMVQADRVRINQVLANLVSNAIKFTEKGYVRIRGYRSAQWVCVEVKDTGIGIAPEYLEQIFEKFRQVDGSSRRQSEGTGLGLAITRYLVQMHGGSIEVKSQPGQGSTFLVKLPVQGQPTE